MMLRHSQDSTPRSRRRAVGDSGAAMVEMALILVVLSFFLFGIISFGYLFSFRQNMTQAAAEGARAAAVAVSGSEFGDAQTAVNLAIKASFGKDCNTAGSGLTCTITPPSNSVCVNDTNLTHKCVKVTLAYDYASKPLLPDAPLIGQFMPSTITVSSTARVS
ncbi:MAG: TadE/TadG family type IV pilus assembly protein [Acidimicrobiales bacterium]